MSVCRFNYKYIKEKATPGSWRRGYEASKTGIVTNIEQKLAGIEAKVKGNFKDHYDVSLSFTKSGVKAQCSCPLKEEWCKHSIAVGIKVNLGCFPFGRLSHCVRVASSEPSPSVYIIAYPIEKY